MSAPIDGDAKVGAIGRRPARTTHRTLWLARGAISRRVGYQFEPAAPFRFSELERLRRPPTRTTGTAFARSLERVDEIGAFQLGRVRLAQVPPNRLAALAR
ncbi:hypothetical protein AB0H88_41595 [Nonomuraea sp. NPDC050680]|uniref:hypothetical protein n=1 Tax=Nonomuraea sp. NPDC050680 TaxID=3154630 RepID=UPI00340215A1